MGFLSRLTDRIIAPLLERSDIVSPNQAQPEATRIALVYKRGSTPPSEAEAEAVFRAALDLFKNQDEIAARILTRISLGSRQVGTLVVDNVEGPDMDVCAQMVWERAGRVLSADGHTGRFRVHPTSATNGSTYFVVFFEPQPSG